MADKDGGLVFDSENVALFGTWTGDSQTSRQPRQCRQCRQTAVGKLARAA